MSDLPCSTSDMYPTILEATGAVAARQRQPLDGVSLVPLMEQKTSSRSKPIAFWSNARSDQRHAALLDWPYKLHVLPTGKAPRKNAKGAEALPNVLLDDVFQDPKETMDLAANEPERVARMTALLDAWKASVIKSFKEDAD